MDEGAPQPVPQEVQQAQPASPEGPTPPSADVKAAEQQETAAAGALRGEQKTGADAGATLQDIAERGFDDAEAAAFLDDAHDQEITDLEEAHAKGEISEEKYNQQKSAL